VPGRFAPGFTPDLDSTRDAIASSTLSHGLMVLGDRWTTAVLMGAFTGVRRFEDWQVQLGIPRSTLTDRLKKLWRWACCARPPTSSGPSASPTG
jgi:DNA-binding HxlR family transcriptional regulator